MPLPLGSLLGTTRHLLTVVPGESMSCLSERFAQAVSLAGQNAPFGMSTYWAQHGGSTAQLILGGSTAASRELDRLLFGCTSCENTQDDGPARWGAPAPHGSEVLML